MMALRVFLFWLLAGVVLVFVAPLGPYFGGIAVHRGDGYSDVLYGWPAYWNFLPAMAWVFSGITVICVLAIVIYEATRER
jgi:hypothetical protein